MTWIAPAYIEQGFDEWQAGFLLTVFALVRVPAAFLFPALADRTGDRRPWLALTLMITAFGLCATGLFPLTTP